MNSTDAPTIFNGYVKKQKINVTHISILPYNIFLGVDLELLTEKLTFDSCRIPARCGAPLSAEWP